MNFGDLNDLEEKEIELLIKELSIIQSKLKGHIIPEKISMPDIKLNGIHSFVVKRPS